MRAAVAGQTSGRLLLAILCRCSVNSLLETVDGIFVASGALLGDKFIGMLDFVGFAVATCAGIFAQN